MQKMAVNPLLLNLLARLHNFCPNELLPQRRTELYQEICDLQLGARPAAKRIVMLLNKPQKRQKVLQAVALEMVGGNTVQIKRRVMLDLMMKPLSLEDKGADVGVFLQQISEVSELLYEPVPREYAFSHLSFRNYFAALEVSRAGLVQHWHEDWWRETVLLHSMICEPMELWALVKAAILEHPGNVHLGYDCLVRYSGEGIKSDWIDEIQTLRYEMLKQLMKEEKWREADQETYRLMISTCGKDPGQGLTVQDLQIFPCENLKVIDDLWVTASNGHFGFSVQKEIWKKCVSLMDCSKVDDKDDKKVIKEQKRFIEEQKRFIEKQKRFMELVGWQSGDNFVDYNDFNFSSSNSPIVELPFSGVGRGGNGLLFITLFSRSDL